MNIFEDWALGNYIRLHYVKINLSFSLSHISSHNILYLLVFNDFHLIAHYIVKDLS